MAKPNKVDLSKVDLKELTQMLVDKNGDLYAAMNSLINNNLVNTNRISEIRRQIARIKTRINQIINQDREEK